MSSLESQTGLNKYDIHKTNRIWLTRLFFMFFTVRTGNRGGNLNSSQLELELETKRFLEFLKCSPYKVKGAFSVTPVCARKQRSCPPGTAMARAFLQPPATGLQQAVADTAQEAYSHSLQAGRGDTAPF